MKRALLLLTLLGMLAAVLTAQRPAADLVLVNGAIYTVDEQLDRVEALAVLDGKIAAIGTTEEIRRWVGSETRVIDLKGKFVLPGFNDAHTHVQEAGQRFLNVDLEGTRSIAEFQQRVRDHLQKLQPGEWVTGGGWDHTLLQENRMPTRADLDAVSTEYPMIFVRVDGHSVVMNSRALEVTGITRDTPDPAGGKITRDASGEPTGWLKDNAMTLVQRHVPTPTKERRKQALLLAFAEAARAGVTSIQDNSQWEDFLLMRELQQEGKLTVRVTEWLPFAEPLDRLEQMRREGGTTDPWLRTGALKAMADGSGGSRSAAMYEDFANDPGNRGFLLIEPERLRKMVIDRDAAGFQIALHAIGDRAIRETLDAFEAAFKTNQRRNTRHRIEHAQYVHHDDFGRFKTLGVIASMQPVHLLAEIRWTRELLGPEREYMAYAVHSIQKAGGRIALGTDYPVEGINPLRGIYAAVAREFESGGPEGGYQPQEKISIEDAIRAYTLGSAYAEFEEKRKGTLSPGKFADLVVLSRDLTRVPPRDILATEVLLTVVGGRVVYEKKSGADLVLTNGAIYTGDEQLGRVEALAVQDGKIVAAGTQQKIKKWTGLQTRIIDLEGKFVMPGFNDNHVHFGGAGVSLLNVSVEGTRSIAEFQQRIRDRLKDFKPGEWITGRGWDHSLWKENRVPTKEDVDAVTTEHPLILTRVDGHSAIANSLALKLAGITGETPAPQGGAIVLDENGEPTGWLKDTAQGLVRRLIPPPSRARQKQGLLLALQDAARNGITSIQDNSSWTTFQIFKELKEEGKLTLRVTEWLPFNASVDRLKQMRAEGGITDPWLKTGALKGVTDGSGGSLSAAMLEPFSNAPGNRGLLRRDPAWWKKMVVERDAAGFQIGLHAIGDRANRVALDAFEAALKANGRRAARHKIEHSQFVHRDDMPRFQELGVIASAQPSHLLSDLRWAPTILGPEREHEAYAWNTLKNLGVVLSFGTDYAVEPLNPLRGLYAAVAREFEDGGPEGGWRPQEKISIEEAIRAYTLGSAYAEFEENRKGTLVPGKFADLVVLSQDIIRVSPRELLQTEVLMTLVGGKIVYEKK